MLDFTKKFSLDKAYNMVAIMVDPRCRVERSLLWEITGSLAAAGNDSRVGKQFLFSKPKIVVK